MSFWENIFHLKENNTTFKTEVFAGITTFMTMAYILFVNPDILANTGMDRGALLTATALASAIATFVMAFYANYPFALAPGMGLNAFFAFTVVLSDKNPHSWQFALTAVFVEGILFIILSLFNVREAIFESIPQNLKYAVSVGIGMFIAFIGLSGAGVVTASPATLLTVGNLTSPGAAIALIGTVITIYMVIKKVTGAIFWGILISYAMALICGAAGFLEGTMLPSSIISMPHSLSPILFQFEFNNILSLDFFVIMFAFLFVDVFDTIGTLIGVSSKAGFLTEDGKLPRVKQALFADAVGTTAGAILGTSTVTTYVESAAGVAEGGRTGLTSFVTGLLFLAALIFTPIFTAVPSFATAPALITVGFFMMGSVTKIDFDDYTEGFPAFMAIIMMPLCYSISEGLIFGVLSYVILKALTGRQSELNPVIVIVATLFFLKIIFNMGV